MIFSGVVQSESIHLYEENDADKICTIGLTMASHEPKFYVNSLEHKDWFWEFRYTGKTDYERVKMCIMEVAAECDSIMETLDALSDVFLEFFSDMLEPEEHVCHCGNGCCSHKLN